MAVGFWLYKSRHTLTALANCARGLPPAAGYQRIGWWHGLALYARCLRILLAVLVAACSWAG
jgi:hypothetical protein